MGAVPVQEAKWPRLGNRATSPTSARMRAAPAGPMPWISISCEPLARTAALSSAFIALSLASRRSMSASSSAAIRRRVLPARSRGRTVASSAWYWAADFFTGAPPGTSSRNSRCIRFSACARARDSSSRRSHSSRSTVRSGSMRQLTQALVAQRDHDDRVRISRVGLAALTGVEHPRPGSELGRHIQHPLPAGQQPLRQRPPDPVRALHRPDPVRPLPGILPPAAGSRGRQCRTGPSPARSPGYPWPRTSPIACGDQPR